MNDDSSLNTSLQDKSFAYISQFAAAPFVLEEMNQFRTKYNKKSILEDIYGLDLNLIGRGLCLPATTCTCLNSLYGIKRFDEASIASMFQILFPLHGTPANDPVTQLPYPNGWQIVTDQGDMYYHAIDYWVNHIAQGEVRASILINYDNLEDISTLVKSSNIVATLSLDNIFTLDWISKIQQKSSVQFIKQDEQGKYIINNLNSNDKPFQNGRHAVSLLDAKDNHLLISDSFALPGISVDQAIRWWPLDTIAKYTQYQSSLPKRAIIFSFTQDSNPQLKKSINNFGIPSAVPN